MGAPAPAATLSRPSPLARAGRAGRRLRARTPLSPTALHDTWNVFWTTRLAVMVLAVVSAATANLANAGNRIKLDIPGLTHPFGGVLGAIFTPLARWDAVWYLGVAGHGYTGEAGGATRGTAFFPLYPMLTRAFAGLSRSPAALLIASYAVSLAAFAVALYLLHRLVTLEIGERYARPTLLLLAVFPAAFFFSAPYSESIFLLLTVAGFYAARRGHFGWAGCLAAGASATRSEGIVLLLPLALIYLYGPRADRSEPDFTREGRLRSLLPRYRPRPDIALLGLAPVGLAAYSLHLALSTGDGLAYMHLEKEWYRSFAGPFVGAWDGIVAAFDGVRQILSGSAAHHYFAAAGGDPFVAAGHNLSLFAFLVFAAVATVGVFRRLPFAYGAYVFASLALPLSTPVSNQPLMSLPRFIAVLFPIFMWLAMACRTRTRRELVLGVFAIVLGVFTVQFATWHWVA